MQSNTDYLNLDRYKANVFITDIEEQKARLRRIRLDFVQKVYGILAAEWLISLTLCILSTYSYPFRDFQMYNTWLFFITLAAVVLMPITMLCYEDAMKRAPGGSIYLIVFTACFAYSVSWICIHTSASFIITLNIMMLLMIFSLIGYAWKTTSDFSVSSSCMYLFGLSFGLFVLLSVLTKTKWLYIIFSAIIVFLYSLYLIYETNVLMKNQNHDISIDDFIFASFMVYVDVIYIFINMLQKLGIMRRES
jgi:FtsH-binding integral membrane protein